MARRGPVEDEPNDWRRSVQGKLTDAYSGYPQSHHDELAALAQGKPIALGEVGTAPTPAILKQSLSHKKLSAATRRLAVSRPQYGTEQNAAILFELGKKVRYDFSCSPKNCFRTFQRCCRNKMIFGR